MSNNTKGLIHLYCGDGKGKTTAAVGLTVRAVGRGQKVVFAQFMKGSETGETNVLCKLQNVIMIRNQKDFGFYQQMADAEKQEITQMHNDTLSQIEEFIKSGQCNVLILDEITYPYAWDLIDKQKVEKLFANKPETLEIVLTGRNPAPYFMEYADYISEIHAVRHPYENGVFAREGIEY